MKSVCSLICALDEQIIDVRTAEGDTIFLFTVQQRVFRAFTFWVEIQTVPPFTTVVSLGAFCVLTVTRADLC